MDVFFRDFFTDPVLLVSFVGLGIVLGLCSFYVGYFIYKVNHDTPKP